MSKEKVGMTIGKSCQECTEHRKSYQECTELYINLITSVPSNTGSSKVPVVQLSD